MQIILFKANRLIIIIEQQTAKITIAVNGKRERAQISGYLGPGNPFWRLLQTHQLRNSETIDISKILDSVRVLPACKQMGAFLRKEERTKSEFVRISHMYNCERIWSQTYVLHLELVKLVKG